MAERNEQVFEMVAGELDKNPDVELETLYERGKEIDPSIGELSLRQFHARYPLPIKRKRSAGKRKGQRARKRAQPARATSAQQGRPRKRPATDGTPHEQVRRILLDFAGDFARAQSKAAVVDVLGNVDDYVNRVVRAAGRG